MMNLKYFRNIKRVDETKEKKKREFEIEIKIGGKMVKLNLNLIFFWNLFKLEDLRQLPMLPKARAHTDYQYICCRISLLTQMLYEINSASLIHSQPQHEGG